ncbi:MAG TPA: Gfo/Idh/MocA family oxidoreductase [Pyrinomonadaceae bacterium]|nr:Gfo/Idh/MocA family oxidoreductase [Pyrinomonadaceae bacterium]
MEQSTAVAVVGCGYWGKNLVRNFDRLGSLALVCDETSGGRERAVELVGQSRVVADLEDVLSSSARGVVVATPAETHYDLARRLLEAGKDVFVEKPLALTYEQGKHLVQLAEERGLILMVGHVLEYHPAIVCLLELVRKGELGKIRYVSSNRLNLGKVRREENILWSFAPHDIAIVLRLVGAMPFQVAAHGGSYVQPNIADVTVTHLLFDNGVRSHIYVSWLHPFKEQRLVIVGSKKMASFDDVSKKLVLYDQRVEIQDDEPVPIKGNGEEIAFSDDEPLLLECRAFLEAMKTRVAPLTDGASGLRVLQVLNAAQRSLVINGDPVTLPLENSAEKGTLVYS